MTSSCCLQGLGLLGEVLEPEPVARFLRHCPGLSKQTIGDLLGENDQFFLDVLDAFTATFNFRGKLCYGEAASHSSTLQRSLGARAAHTAAANVFNVPRQSGVTDSGAPGTADRLAVLGLSCMKC